MNKEVQEFFDSLSIDPVIGSVISLSAACIGAVLNYLPYDVSSNLLHILQALAFVTSITVSSITIITFLVKNCINIFKYYKNGNKTK